MKFKHIISINLVIESEVENRPDDDQIRNSLSKFMEENDKDLSDSVEWVDTEIVEEPGESCS